MPSKDFTITIKLDSDKVMEEVENCFKEILSKHLSYEVKKWKPRKTMHQVCKEAGYDYDVVKLMAMIQEFLESFGYEVSYSKGCFVDKMNNHQEISWPLVEFLAMYLAERVILKE